jgi:hypothetical protein
MRAAIAFASLAVVVAVTASPAADSPIARMGWMEGRWTGVSGGVQMEEHWTSAAGDGLVGMHKDVKAGKMVSFEFFRIEAHADGIYYMTSPGGRPATPFKLVEQSDRRLVFENAAHDFPQRILYWSRRTDELRARIEGTLDGKPDSMEWRWIRAKR